jgi:hypothetical protein
MTLLLEILVRLVVIPQIPTLELLSESNLRVTNRRVHWLGCKLVQKFGVFLSK